MKMDQDQLPTTTQSGEVVLAKYDNLPGHENMDIEGGQQMEEQVLGYLEVQPSQLQAVQEGGTIYFQSDGLELDEQLILAQGGEGGEMIIVVRTDQDGMNFTGEGGESGLRAVKFGDLAGLAEQMGLAPGTKISLQSEDDKEDGSGITYLTYEAPGEEYEQQMQEGLQTNENISENTYLQEHGEMTEIPVSVSEDGTLTPLRIIEKPNNVTNSEQNETIAVISIDDKNMSDNAYLHEQGEITEIPVSVSEDGTITPLRIVEKPCDGENTSDVMREGDENQCFIAVGVNGEELDNVEGFNSVVDGENHTDLPNKHPMVVHLSSHDESRNTSESDSQTTTVEVLREPDSNQAHFETANGENSFQTTIVTSDGEHQQVEYRIVQASDVEGERLQPGMTDAECYGQWSAMDTSGQELSNDMIVNENQNDENVRHEEQVTCINQADQENSDSKPLSESADPTEETPVNETLRSIEEFLRTGETDDNEVKVIEKVEVDSTTELNVIIEKHPSKEEDEVAVGEQQNTVIPIEITLENDTQEIHEMEVMGELPQNTTSYVVIDLDNAQQFTNAMGNSIQMESVNFKSVINEHGQSVGILETANGDLEVILDSESLVPSANSPFTKSNHDDEISIISNHSSLQEVLAPQFQKAFQKLLNTPEKRASPEPSSYQVNLSSGKSKSNSKYQSESEISKRGEKTSKAPREKKQTVFDIINPPEDLTLKIPTRQYSRTYSRKKTTPPPVASTSKDTPTIEPQGNEFGRNEIILVIEPNESESLKYEKKENELRKQDLELSPKKLEIVCDELENKIEKVEDSSEDNISNSAVPKTLTTDTEEIISNTKEVENDIDLEETDMTRDDSNSNLTVSQTSVEHFEPNTKLSSELLGETCESVGKSQSILPETQETLTIVPEKLLETALSCENFEKLPESITEDPEPNSDSVSLDICGIPQEDLTKSEEWASIPEKHMAVSQEVLELPQETVAIPSESVATPIEAVSVHQDMIASREDSLETQQEITEPLENVSIPLEDASIPNNSFMVSQNPNVPSIEEEEEKEKIADMEVNETDAAEMGSDEEGMGSDEAGMGSDGGAGMGYAIVGMTSEDVAIPDDVEIPSDDVEIPSDDVEIPSDDVEIPSDDVEIPSDDVEIPSDDVEINSDDVEIPSDDVEIPSDDVEIPSDDVEIPSDDVEIPSGDVQILSGDVQIPSGDVEIPSGDVEIPSGDVEIPSGDVEIPSGDVEIPSGDVEIPSGDVEIPSGDVEIPSGDVEIPSGDVEIPSDDVEIPSDDVEIPSDDIEIATNDVPEAKVVPKPALGLEIEHNSLENELSATEENSLAVAKKSSPKTTEPVAKLPEPVAKDEELTSEQDLKEDHLDEPESEIEKGESENERMESEMERIDSEIDNDIRDSVLSGGKSISADEENSQFDFDREESFPDKDNEDVMKETIVLDDNNLDSIKINTEEGVKERRGRKRQSENELNKEAKRKKTGETRQKISTSSSVSVIKEKNVKRKLFNENSGKKIGRPKKNSSGGKAYQSQDELFDELLKESIPNVAKKRKDSKDYSRKSKVLNSDVKRRRTLPPRLPNDYPSSDEEDVVLSNLFPYPEKKYKSVGKGKRGRGKTGRPRLYKNRGSSDEEEVMMSNLRIYPEVQGQKQSYNDSSKRGRGRPRISKNVSASSYSRFDISSRQSKSEPTKRGRGKQKTGASYMRSKSKRTKKECEIHFCYQQSNPEKTHQIYTCKECHFRTSRMANIIRHYKECSLDLFPFKSSSLVERTPNRFKLDVATGSKSLSESRFLNKKVENPKKLSLKSAKSNKSRRNDDPSASRDENSMETDDQENTDVTCDSEEEDSYDIEMKNTFGFAENDVVWAEWRNQHWPALVRKIYPRQKKVSVFFISTPMPDKGFTMNVKKITNFDDAAKNKDFLEKGYSLQKNDQLVKSAQLAEDYLRKKCLGLKMSALQFFNDPEAAKQMLSELEESAENPASDQSDSHANDPMTPIAVIDLNRLTNPAQDDEIPAETEDREDYDKEGEKIAKFILEGNSNEHLIQVYSGVINSERHRLFSSDLQSDRASVKRASNYKGAVEDEGKKVELTQYCMELFKNKITASVGFNVVGYAYEVMVPEAILKAMSTLHNITLGEAENIFAKNDVDKTQSIFSTSISESEVGHVVADQAIDTLVLASDSADRATKTLILTPDSVDQTTDALILAPESVDEENPLTIDSASPPRETCPETLTELPT